MVIYVQKRLAQKSSGKKVFLFSNAIFFARNALTTLIFYFHFETKTLTYLGISYADAARFFENNQSSYAVVARFFVKTSKKRAKTSKNEQIRNVGSKKCLKSKKSLSAKLNIYNFSLQHSTA